MTLLLRPVSRGINRNRKADHEERAASCLSPNDVMGIFSWQGPISIGRGVGYTPTIPHAIAVGFYIHAGPI